MRTLLTDSEPDVAADPIPGWIRALPAIAVLAAAARYLFLVRGYGLLGWDAYPLIVASRIRSTADLLGTFTEQLMDGRYPGTFYRPLANLSFAADYALWELNPFGYHLSSVLTFSGCALALALLAARLVGPKFPLTPLVVVTVFVAHPLVLEVLPVVPRRPEFLCAMFMALALWLQLAPKALGSARPPLLPALFTLLAIASKETGFILPVLVPAAVALCSTHRRLVPRLLHGALNAAPHVVVAVALLGARLAVLGRIGGQTELSVGVLDALRYVGFSALRLVVPQPEEVQTMAFRWVPVISVGLAVLVAIAILIRASRGARLEGALRLGALGAIWIALSSAAAYAAGNWVAESYFLMPLIGWAMVVGALAGVLGAAARQARSGARFAALAAMVLLVLPLTWQATYSPLVRTYDEWSRATELQRVFLDDTRQQIEAAADSSLVYAAPLPLRVVPHYSGPRIRSTAILHGYSVQAWAELVFPGRNIRVVIARGVVEGPFGDEVLVLLTQLSG